MPYSDWASRIFREALDKARRQREVFIEKERLTGAICGQHDAHEPIVATVALLECVERNEGCDWIRNHFRCWSQDPLRGRCPYLKGEEDG